MDTIHDYTFPTEIIDLIVGACGIEDLYTFILVSKRYSRLFDAECSDNYFKFPPLETLIPVNSKIPSWVKNRKDTFRRKCFYQNRFTKVPDKYYSVKYISFDHPKFPKEILEDKRFLMLNEHNVFTHQNSRSINIYHNIVAERKNNFSYGYALQYNIWDYEVFCDYVNLTSDAIASYVYDNVILTYERLEYLLSIKRLFVNWSHFITLYDDIDMYKRVYQAHIENNIIPELKPKHNILGVKKEMIKWILSTGINIKKDCFVTDRCWNIDTVLYLHKKGIFSHREVWTQIDRSSNFENIYQQLVGKIPFPNSKELTRNNVNSRIIVAKIALEKNGP